MIQRTTMQVQTKENFLYIRLTPFFPFIVDLKQFFQVNVTDTKQQLHHHRQQNIRRRRLRRHREIHCLKNQTKKKTNRIQALTLRYVDFVSRHCFMRLKCRSGMLSFSTFHSVRFHAENRNINNERRLFPARVCVAPTHGSVLCALLNLKFSSNRKFKGENLSSNFLCSNSKMGKTMRSLRPLTVLEPNRFSGMRLLTMRLCAT